MELECKRPSVPLLISYKVTRLFFRDVNRVKEARNIVKDSY